MCCQVSRNLFLIFSVYFFFIAYSLLAIIRHNTYQSYGFDLGITDQIVWEYSRFEQPITTVHYYPYTSILTDHVELVYIPLSIFYWVWSDPRMLLLLQAAIFCLSGLPLYYLATEKKLMPLISYSLLLSFLTFYGAQNALWFDVHSEVFGASFLAWFIYFLDKKNKQLSTLFFVLTIICKEDMAMFTLLVTIVYFFIRRSKFELGFIAGSILYLGIIFGIYFPYFTKLGYEYQNTNGLLANLNPYYFINTQDKRSVIIVSLGWFGFLPLLQPLYLIPFLGDLYTYFVIGNQIKEADGLFMHYRITLDALLIWSTIKSIDKVKFFNRWHTAAYLLILLLLFQYTLHLPLSYLTKKWFWEQPPAVKNITTLLTYLPQNASVVSQNNITPHISERHNVFTLWPETKKFDKDSPCGKQSCNWLAWRGKKPQYLIVDTSANWDIRHFLTQRETFIDGLNTMEKEKVITKDKQVGNAILYKINN